ncbi:DNA primase, partial [Vibrio parahaemolyticus]|nr:DNA primase [Vibrio parahaemolyticus]
EIIGEKPVQTHRNTWLVEVKTKSVRTAKPESVAQAKVSNSSYVSHSAPGSYNEESWADSNVPTEQHEDNHSSCSPVEHHQEAVVEQEHSESKVVPLFAEQSKPW